MSFNTAVSGLQAASSDLDIISNNIANAATTGFKESRAEFGDVFASTVAGNSSTAIGDGVRLQAAAQQFAQGTVAFTDNALDLAINGNGFFILSDQGAPVYSRAGNFGLDTNGFLVNPVNQQLQGFQADATGTITGLQGPLQITNTLADPNATTAVTAVLNLDSRETPPGTAWPAAGFDPFDTPDVLANAPDPDMFSATTATTIFDSLGNSHGLSLYFLKTANPNEWQVEALVDGVSQTVDIVEAGVSTAGNTMTFQSDGRFDPTITPVELSLTGWDPLDANGNSNGATTPQNFTTDLSQSTQFGSDFAVTSLIQDGFTTGQLRGVDIDESGVVFARFTNGQSRALGQVALANFSNPQGLSPLGDTTWAETFASGLPVISDPGTAGLGVIQSGALEESNVELTQQLVKMIIAQRNFQANAQVIQTEDAVTQAIINIR